MQTSDRYLPCDYCGCVFKVEPYDEYWDDDQLICLDCTLTGITKIDVMAQYDKENVFANYSYEPLPLLSRREKVIQEFFNQRVDNKDLGRYNIVNRIKDYWSNN